MNAVRLPHPSPAARAAPPPDGGVLDPDRLFPVDTRARAVARDLYSRVADLPIISPHGHVDPRLLVDDAPFPDPARLLVTDDHYVTRLLHAGGVEMSSLRLGPALAEPREVWRALASNWHLFAGTASGYWLADELATLFGVTEGLSAASADESFDRITAQLSEPRMRPRALFEAFGIEVLATTDDPLDDLTDHRTLAQDPSFSGRVIPTFRPDAYITPATPGFREKVERLMDAGGRGAGRFRRLPQGSRGEARPLHRPRRRVGRSRCVRTPRARSHSRRGFHPLPRGDGRQALAGRRT